MTTVTDQLPPRVKLPDPPNAKPVVPGPNSWALEQEQERERASQSNDGPPTVRDRYEHKPMPPIPADEPIPPNTFVLQPKSYIQPAIPLVKPPAMAQNPKNRAVTDPITPSPLFAATRKVSVSQLRKKYSQSKRKSESPKPDSKDKEPHITSEKAARVLGLPERVDAPKLVLPSSAPAGPASEDRNGSEERLEEGKDTPARQVQSSPVPTRNNTPVLTRRYLKENGLPNPIPDANAPTESIQRASTPLPRPSEDVPRKEFLAPAQGFFHPKVGTHRNVGAVGLVDGSGMHRVESFRGVIEDVPEPYSGSEHIQANADAAPSQPRTPHTADNADSIGYDMYPPSNYKGIWENDPAVGHSLPPFSPMPKQPAQDPPFTRHGASQPNLNRYSHYQQPPPSANSWASESKYGSTVPPAALWPPQGPYYVNSNSVPSPPQNQYDFQRSNSTPAALAQIELTLHHHLDTSFGFLSRLVTNKHDQANDQMLRQFESMEDTISKCFKDLKTEIKDIRKQVSNIQGDMKDLKKRSDRAIELIRGHEGKLEALGKNIEDHGCKCPYHTPDPSSSEPESDRHKARSEASSHRRTESAHAAIAPNAAHQQNHRRGISRSSNNARISGTSSKRGRSNTATSQQAAAGRPSEDRENRREIFAGISAALARGQRPDLRDHPAYVGMQQGQGLGFGHEQTGLGIGYDQSLQPGGWYHQAYGQNN